MLSKIIIHPSESVLKSFAFMKLGKPRKALPTSMTCIIECTHVSKKYVASHLYKALQRAYVCWLTNVNIAQWRCKRSLFQELRYSLTAVDRTSIFSFPLERFLWCRRSASRPSKLAVRENQRWTKDKNSCKEFFHKLPVLHPMAPAIFWSRTHEIAAYRPSQN